MLPALATLADLEARIGHALTDADEITRANALLDDASALVRFETGKTWVDELGGLVGVPDFAITVTATAALRGWYNPAQIESAQLGAVSVRYGGAWLTESERERLGMLVGRGGLTSIQLTPGFGFERDLTGWVPVDNAEGLSTPAADWFPFGT